MKRGSKIAVIMAVGVLALFFSGWTWFARTAREWQEAAAMPTNIAARPAAAASASAHSPPMPSAPRSASTSPNRPIRPLPPPGAPLRQVLASLKAQAAEGDAAAACRIAFELDRCAKVPLLSKAVKSFAGQALSKLTGPARAERERQDEKMRAWIAQAEAACDGVPADEMAWTFDYGLSAALAGNREARWMMSSWPVGLDAMRPERTLEGWARWRQHIGSILEAGIAAGDPRIMSMAARAYTEVTWGYRVFPEDTVRATALHFAVARASSESFRPAEERSASATARRADLTPEQVEEARRLSATFSIAQAPEGGVDWSRGMNPLPDGSACERER